MFTKRLRSRFYIGMLGLLCIIVFWVWSAQSDDPNQGHGDVSELLQILETQEVSSLYYQGVDNGEFLVRVELPAEDVTEYLVPAKLLESVIEIAQERNVKLLSRVPSSGFIRFVSTSWPMLILLPINLAIVILFIRFQRSSLGSKAKAITDPPKERFKDVAAVGSAKAALEEIVHFLKEPEKFRRAGGRVPKGVLLSGPPGNGKTLLARAVAGEAHCPFFSASGSDFAEIFVGVGASRIRRLFNAAKAAGGGMIFLDEIDTVGAKRGKGHREDDQTLNAVLVEMDGFEQDTGIIVIAATNRPEVLDPALTRPGRFDRTITVDKPKTKEREDIFQRIVRRRGIDLAEGVDLALLARLTSGSSGADLANILNEAAILAALDDRESVSMRDLEDARDKTLMGSPGSLIVFEPLLRSTAIHEAGHATAAHHLLRSHDVHSASVRPQGRALGRVIMVPRHDEELVTYYDILAHIAVMLAGRAAEVLEGALLESSPGAEDDLKQASELAYAAVTKWGFGSRTGPHSVVCQDGDISEFLLNRIDADVAGILDYCMRLATNCLKEHRSFHRALAERLERDHSLRLSDLEGIEQQLSA